MFGEVLDAIVEVRARCHLKRYALEIGVVALDERDRLKPDLGCENGAVLVARDDVEADDLVVIFDRPFEVGR